MTSLTLHEMPYPDASHGPNTTPWAYASHVPLVTFSETSLVRTMGDPAHEDKSVTTKTDDGPNTYSNFLGEVIEAYWNGATDQTALVEAFTRNEVNYVNELAHYLVRDIDGLIGTLETLEPETFFAIYYKSYRFQGAHLAKFRALRTLLSLCELEERFLELEQCFRHLSVTDP
jgi:hypothetical protein